MKPKDAAISIRPFSPADQAQAQRLILEGMKEHWGYVDPDRNPDLNDIAVNYPEGSFIVAARGRELVGTGALVTENLETARIVRMSVAKDHRRSGIGTSLLRHLCGLAIAAGCRRIVLETTSSWSDAVAFYQEMGFRVSHAEEGNTHFVLDLQL
jgi:GNAT superfamily N-acetyltransferase